MILVTGGAGYIGSHVCAELLGAGRAIAVFDDFSRSTPAAIDRIATLTGRRPEVFRGDVRDATALGHALYQTKARTVIHLAGMKSVAKSFLVPSAFHAVNVQGVQALVSAARRAGVQHIVFSSSATVYAPACGPVAEDAALEPASPYARSKLEAEQRLQGAADAGLSVAILRYFNAGGAHESGALGDEFMRDGDDIVSSLVRAQRQALPFRIHGTGFDTRDGSCERDYVHVQDLAGLHLRVIDWLDGRAGLHVFNAGSGQGTTVLEALQAFEYVSGGHMPWVAAAPRPGDRASYLADTTKCTLELGWSAARPLTTQLRDALRWYATIAHGVFSEGSAPMPMR